MARRLLKPGLVALFISLGTPQAFSQGTGTDLTADAGPDQIAQAGEPLRLDGTGSTTLTGSSLTYNWEVISGAGVPTISDLSVPRPIVTLPSAGDYVLELTVSDNGVVSAPDRVTLSTLGVAPIANAGNDRAVSVGDLVRLDGAGSTSATGEFLSYTWLLFGPDGSASALSSVDTARATLLIDVEGDYEATLLVSDESGRVSAADTVVLSTLNTAPIAEAGPSLVAAIGETITLDSDGTIDADGDSLGASWSLISAPSSSLATLEEDEDGRFAFTADATGDYVVQLAASDASATSRDTLVVSVGGGIAPVADAGPDRSVVLGGQTRLTGGQSTDVDGDRLSYSWSLIGAPAGSSADLDAEVGFETMFTADVAGDYVVQLSVSDGVSSTTDTVLLSTGTVRSVVSAGDDMRLIADRATLVGAGDGTVVWSVPGLSAGTELAELATPTAQTSEVFFPGQAGGGTVSGDDAQAALDLLSTYSVVTEGNVDAAVDIEGRSLIGGSLVGNSATFGSRLNGQQGTDFITVAGNITGGPKNINNGGNVRFGGTVSTNLNLNGGGSRINDPTVSAAEEISLLRDLSVDLSNAPANSVAQIPSPSGQNGPVRFIASPDESGVAVFDIEDGDLLLSNDRVQQIEMQLNGADAVIINVGGSNIRFDRGNIVGSFSNDSVSRKVIWNFHEATNVFFERAVEGTVLAPNAFVENRTNIDGSVIATSLRARGPIRLQSFNGEGLVGGASESVSFALAQLTTTASSEDEPAFDTAVLTTGNLRPIANAGTGSIVAGGEVILLSGAASVDFDGDDLTYTWALLNAPQGSSALLNNQTSQAPTLTPGVAGLYAFQLIVSDGRLQSRPATVAVEVQNTAPVANAGPDLTSFVGAAVQLDGSGSSDIDDDPLSFAWTVSSAPAGSVATLSDVGATSPVFTPDARGSYTFSLTVSDGQAESEPDTVTLLAPNRLPVANAGTNGLGEVGETIVLSATASSDPDGDGLSFVWTLAVPTGSSTSLVDADTAAPSFSPDVPGSYTATLVVSDGTDSSAPASVTFTVTDPGQPPVLAAIPNQTVSLGSTLSFTLSASDPNDDPLTFFALPFPLPQGVTLDATTGEVTYRPVLQSQVGELVLEFGVSDGALEAVQTVTLTVTEPADGSTLFSGRVVDATDGTSPLAGATVMVGGASAITNSDGTFLIVEPAEGRQVVMVIPADGTVSPGNTAYASAQFVAEIVPGGENARAEAVLLPRINGATAQVVAGVDTVITDPARGLTVVVPADSALDMTPAPASRFWRVFVQDDQPGSPNNIAIAEVTFLDDGGHEILIPEDVTPIRSSQFSSNTPAFEAFDNDVTSRWTGSSGANEWVGLDFGIGNEVSIDAVMLQAGVAGNNPQNQFPLSFNLEYSNDGVTWNALFSITNISSVEQGEERRFDRPASTAPFTGAISLAAVGPEEANILPDGVVPCELFSLDPKGVRFDSAISVRTPNYDNLPAGSSVNVWLFDGDRFTIGGMGTVADDGLSIAAEIEGVIGGSLIALTPRAPVAVMAADQPVGTYQPGLLTDGALISSYQTPSYRSLGRDRSFQFIYNSAAAEGRQIVGTEVTFDTVVPEQLTTELIVGGQSTGTPAVVSLSNPAPVEAGDTIRVASLFDGSSTPTGAFSYEHLVRAQYACSAVVTSSQGRVLVSNESDSFISPGWTLAGLESINQQDDGSIVLSDGFGGMSVFELGGTGVDSDGDIGEIEALPGSLLEGQAESDLGVRVFLESSSRELVSVTPFDDYSITSDQAFNVIEAGSLPAGAIVTSYLVHFDPETEGIERTVEGTVTFPRDVIAIQTNAGTLLVGDGTLGGSTLYPNDSDRGLEEGSDEISIASDLRTLSVRLSELDGVDQIRVITIGLQREVIASRFEMDDEGWTVRGPNRGFEHTATGGNPGGAILSIDQPSNFQSIRFAAPEQFLGDRSEFFNGWLTYQLRATPVDAGINSRRELVITGTENKLILDVPYQPAQDFWTHFAVLLNPEIPNWRIVPATVEPFVVGFNPDNEPIPTEEQFRQVLSNVTDIEILAEYRTGEDTARLDNVVLFQAAPAEDDLIALSPPGDFTELTRNADGTFTRRFNNGVVYEFDTSGLLETSTDRNGNVETFEYDEDGRLLSVTDPAGLITTFTYDAAGMLDTITDPAGRVVEAVTDRQEFFFNDPDGTTRQMIADANGRIFEEVSKRGFSTTHSFGAGGAYAGSGFPDGSSIAAQVSRAAGLADLGAGIGTEGSPAPHAVPNGEASLTDGRGATTTIRYNEFSAPIEITDRLGRKTEIIRNADNLPIEIRTPTEEGEPRIDRISYDDQGNVLEQIEAVGTWAERSTQFEYEPVFFNVTQITDPDGFETVFEYNGFGDLLNITDAEDGIQTFDYDSRGLRTLAIDQNGNETLFAYDPDQFNLLSIVDASGTVTEFSRDAAGNITQQTDDVGGTLSRTTFSEFDALNRLISFANAEGDRSITEYDEDGNLVRSIDPTGVVLSNTFDELNRNTSVEDPTFGLITFEYDANGNFIRQTDADANVTVHRYDAEDRLIESLDALLQLRSYSYDSRNNVVRLTDANDNTTLFQYDIFDRITRRTNALGDTWTHAYDLRDNRVLSMKPDGVVITGSFDALSRAVSIVGISVSGETGWNYQFDAASNLLSAEVTSGVDLTFTYDDENRVSRAATSNVFKRGEENAALSYSYDALDRRSLLSDSYQGNISYSYDSADRIVGIVNPRDEAFEFAYDKSGRVSRRSSPNLSILNRTYDAISGRLIEQENLIGGNAVAHLSYNYDSLGNIEKITETGVTTRARNFEYDSLTRLSVVKRTDGQLLEEYALDPEGNRISSHLSSLHVVDGANRLIEDDDYTFVYDLNGNLIRKNPKLVSLSEWEYEYDVFDQLLSVKRDSVLIEQYQYDALGQRISVSDSDGMITAIVYDGVDRYLDLTDNGTIGVLSNRYIYADVIDEPLQLLRYDADGAVQISLTYHSDHQRSVRYMSDSSGAISNTYDYDTYGNHTTIIEAALQPLQYTGREWNRDSNLFHYRARVYDPSIGRFLQEDPIGFQSGDLNVYRYTGSNPVNFSDPSGLATLSETAILQNNSTRTLTSGGIAAGAGTFSTGARTSAVLQGGRLSTLSSIAGRSACSLFTIADALGAASAGETIIGVGGCGVVSEARPTETGISFGERIDAGRESRSGRCTPQRQNQLQNNKNRACSKPKSCTNRRGGNINPNLSTSDILERIANGNDCAAARSRINNECFLGGDKTHQDVLQSVRDNINTCRGAL